MPGLPQIKLYTDAQIRALLEKYRYLRAGPQYGEPVPVIVAMLGQVFEELQKMKEGKP